MNEKTNKLKDLQITYEPRGENRTLFFQSMLKNDLTAAEGPAGVGKTTAMAAAALLSLISGRVEKIILARPTIGAGEENGFRPGSVEEKISPYLRPLLDAMEELAGKSVIQSLLSSGRIEFLPVEMIQGRNLKKSFVILDEAENMTFDQLKTFCERPVEGSILVVSGDASSVYLKNPKDSALKEFVENVRAVAAGMPEGNIVGVGCVQFTTEDIIRGPMTRIVVATFNAIAEKRAAAGALAEAEQTGKVRHLPSPQGATGIVRLA